MLYVLLVGCALTLSAMAAMAGAVSGLQPDWLMVSRPLVTVLTALAIPILYVILCAGAALQAVRAHEARSRGGPSPHRHYDLALERYQRITNFARILLLASFAFLLFFSRWIILLLVGLQLVYVPLVASLAVMTPLLVAVVLGWVVQWPADRLLREAMNADLAAIGRRPAPAWTFRTYFAHQMRQHLLFVLVPMSAILLVSDLMLRYGPQLRQLCLPLPFGASPLPLHWLDQALIGLTSLLVFLLAPLLVRWLWITRPLEAGVLRYQLEHIAREHGVRFRDILVWQAGPGLANAAVIGVAPPLRYVLISEGLLEGMSPRQIEGVFGHELGHLVHHHIPKLVACSLTVMIGVGAVLLGLDWLLFIVQHQYASHLPDSLRKGLAHSGPWLELAGLLLVGWVWYVGFGRLSRLYERQADQFGALQCDDPSSGATPAETWWRTLHDLERAPVLLASGLVGEPAPRPTPALPEPQNLSAAGAKRFASALELVGYLNGMDPHHFDWRHGTLHQREAHVVRLAEDPLFARAFATRLGRLDRVLWLSAAISLAAAGGYYLFWT